VVFGGVVKGVIEVLFPHLSGVVVERIEAVGPGVRVWARTAGADAQCPSCGAITSRVHSRYRRSLQDATVAGRPVDVRLLVCRFRCSTTPGRSKARSTGSKRLSDRCMAARTSTCSAAESCYPDQPRSVNTPQKVSQNQFSRGVDRR
jgi:transposase